MTLPALRPDDGTPPAALAATGVALGDVAEHLGFSVGAPSGEGWVGLDDVVGSGLLDWLAADLVATEGRRDVAGSYLGGHLAGPVVSRTVAAIALHQRCPDPHPAGVAVHLHADGWFDQVAFRRPTVAVLPGDPAAGQPGTLVVADPAALRAWWAERTSAAVGPLLESVRHRLPYGRRGLWGAVADAVAGTMLTVARATGRPGGQAWGEASALLDAMAAWAPVPLTRPTPFRVSRSGSDAWFTTKGTCCLYYRTVNAPDPCGEGYCSTCPLADPAHRRCKLAAWLDEQAASTPPDRADAMKREP